MQRFKIDGVSHHIDNGDNHFINGKCVNPKRDSNKSVVSTHPPMEGRTETKVETYGHVYLDKEYVYPEI